MSTLRLLGSTVLSAAASHNLADVASARTELGIVAPNAVTDAWLTQAIAQVSRAIEKHTRRVFVPEVVQETFEPAARDYNRPQGTNALQLGRWPVASVVSVTLTLGGAAQTLVEGTDFLVDAANGTLTRLDPTTGHGTNWIADRVAVTYLAGYGASVTEAATVPTSPYQVTVSQSAEFSCDIGVTYAGSPLVRVAANPAAGQYAVSAGVYTFAAADAGHALTVTYGTADVPADLQEICLRLVTARYKSRDRDPALVQRETPGVGVERWWVGQVPGQTGPFAPEIEYALDQYVAPVVA